MVAVTVELKGFEGTLQLLQSLPAEVVSKRGGPVKAGLRKGALVLLRQAKLNLARSTENLSGDYTTTGLLESALIASRGRPPPGENGERYLVRVKRKSYALVRSNTEVSTQQTAEWLEYGNEHQPAEPWLRPAFNEKAAEAISTVERETLKAIDRVVKKLAAQNKGR